MDIVDANSKQTADSRQARTCILFYLICLWTMCAQCKSVRSEEGPGLGSRSQDRDPGPGRQLAAWAHRAPWDPKGFLGHEEGPRVILGLQGDPASAISHVCVCANALHAKRFLTMGVTARQAVQQASWRQAGRSALLPHSSRLFSTAAFGRCHFLFRSASVLMPGVCQVYSRSSSSPLTA